MNNKPYSEACARNQKPILNVLKEHLVNQDTVVEIGSGTGQHAVFFAEHLPSLQWQPTDLTENLGGIQTWIDDAKLPNVKSPIALDVSQAPWPIGPVSSIFTANTLHIMSWHEVTLLFQQLATQLSDGGKMICYGPFNVNGQFTSESNSEFDQWLKLRDPNSGIRDINALVELAKTSDLELIDTYQMPANNMVLVWLKS